MGNLFSEPEDWEQDNSKRRQRRNQQQHNHPSRPLHEPQHYAPYPYNQRPQQQNYQQQQMRPQQQQQQQQQQPQRRHVSTAESLDFLDCEFTKTVEIIRNMKKEKTFDAGLRSYICEVMIEKETLLRNFNNSMDPRRRAAADEELERLRDKIKYLEEENSLLNTEKKHLDGLLTSSMREPSTRSSNHASPSSSGYSDNKDRKEHKDKAQKSSDTREQEKVKDLQHQLTLYTRDLEKERAAKVKAVSYIDHLKQQLEEVKTEKNALEMRLRKMAGDRLLRNNPAIADLSDPNRPTKIGKMYSEIYDNEWTNAFEALSDAGYEEEDAIETLRLTLLNVFQFCSRKADSLLKKTEEAVNISFEEYKATEQKKAPRHLTMPRNLFSKILQAKISPKEEETAESYGMVSGRKKRAQDIHKQEDTQEEIGDFRRATLGIEDIPELKPFILKCLQLGWMMAMQNPPVVFQEHHSDVDIVFDKDLYKKYKTSGPLIKFVVWPALLLHENGPLLAHGFAEGKQRPDIY